MENETKHSRSLRFESEPKWWIPVVQQRTDNKETDAAGAVPQSKEKSKSPVERVQKKRLRCHSSSLHKKRCDQKSDNAIRNQTHEAGKDLRRARNSQSGCFFRIVNEAARDQEGNGDGGGSQAPQRGRRPAERNQFDTRKNQIATVLNSIHQFKIQAHSFDRSRSAQEINKHVSDVINKDREKSKKRKTSANQKLSGVDVMDTLQRAISNVEKEMAKNLTLLRKEIDTRNTNNATVALINSFQRTVLKRTTEQITDVSRGNIAAFVVIDQFLLKLGTLTIIENAHNTR